MLSASRSSLSSVILLIVCCLVIRTTAFFHHLPRPVSKGAEGREMIQMSRGTGGSSGKKNNEGGGTLVKDRTSLDTLKSGAFNRTISISALERAMDFSLLTLHRERNARRVARGQEKGEEIEDGSAADRLVDVLGPMSGPSPFHPIFGRWELSFVSLKRFPLPFYCPLENVITLERQGPAKIEARMTLFDGMEFPLGAFTVTENSTRSERAPQGEGEGVLYGLQLESIKPGTKMFDLVIYKNDDDFPVLVVKSSDGEEAWLLSNIEKRMRKREANVHKYAKEILNLERKAQKPVSWRRSNPNMIGHEVMRNVWGRVFKRVDQTFNTDLANNDFLLNIAPFLPIFALVLLIALTGDINTQFGKFGEMGFLR